MRQRERNEFGKVKVSDINIHKFLEEIKEATKEPEMERKRWWKRVLRFLFEYFA